MDNYNTDNVPTESANGEVFAVYQKSSQII